MLLDWLEGQGDSGAYDKAVTPDVCLTVAMAGEHDLSVYKNGHWRHSVQHPASVSLTNSGESNRLRWRGRPAGVFSSANLYIPLALLRDAAEQLRRPGQPLLEHPAVVSSSNKRILTTSVSALLRALRAGAPDIYAEQAARWLSAHLVWSQSGIYDPRLDRRDAGQISDRRLSRTIDYILVNYGRSLTVARLAEEAGVSPFHFCRLFKKATGSAPHQYLREVRLLAAKSRLHGTDNSISAIASECGYVSPSAFVAAFVRRFGRTPKEERARIG